MRVIDTVKKSFFRYPTLYLNKNFDSIKFGILHHYFITLGNGIEWANTKNPKQGGYLIEPRYYNRERVYDAPYGKEIIDIDITPYLQANKVYELGEIDHEETKSFLKTMFSILDDKDVDISEERKMYYLKKFIRSKSRYEREKVGKILWLESEFDKLPEKTLLPDQMYNVSFKYFLREIEPREEDSLGRRNPYPNFQKQYSCFWEKGVEYIQEDWRIEALNHLHHWKYYFNDSERVKEYTHNAYGNDSMRKELFNTIKRFINKEGKSVKEACAFYGFKPCDVNDENAILQVAKERWEEDLSEIKSFIDETIYKLLK